MFNNYFIYGVHFGQAANLLTFENTMKNVEHEALDRLITVIDNILRNNKYAGFRNIFENMFAKFKKFGCYMSVKLYFSHSH